MRFALATCAALVFFVATTSATAATIVSYGFSSLAPGSAVTGSGIGVIGASAGDTWMLDTDATSTSTVALLDVAGGTTPYTFAHSGFIEHVGGGAANAAGAVSPFENSWFDGATSNSYTFGGFTEGDIVDFVFFGTYHLGLLRGAKFTIGTTSKETTGEAAVQDEYSELRNYVRFDDLVVDASGVISVGILVTGANTALDVNGFQMSVTTTPTPAPEPSTFVLAAIGLVGLVTGRRRRRR